MPPQIINTKLVFPHWCSRCRKFMLPRTECILNKYTYNYYRGNTDKIRTSKVKVYYCNSCYMENFL